MSCSQCGAACQGGLCKQCEIERQFAHQAEELARNEETEGDDE